MEWPSVLVKWNGQVEWVKLSGQVVLAKWIGALRVGQVDYIRALRVRLGYVRAGRVRLGWLG